MRKFFTLLKKCFSIIPAEDMKPVSIPDASSMPGFSYNNDSPLTMVHGPSSPDSPDSNRDQDDHSLLTIDHSPLTTLTTTTDNKNDYNDDLAMPGSFLFPHSEAHDDQVAGKFTIVKSTTDESEHPSPTLAYSIYNNEITEQKKISDDNLSLNTYTMKPETIKNYESGIMNLPAGRQGSDYNSSKESMRTELKIHNSEFILHNSLNQLNIGMKKNKKVFHDSFFFQKSVIGSDVKIKKQQTTSNHYNSKFKIQNLKLNNPLTPHTSYFMKRVKKFLRQTGIFAIALTALFVFASMIANATTYYTNVNGSPNTLANWWTVNNGTGSHPQILQRLVIFLLFKVGIT